MKKLVSLLSAAAMMSMLAVPASAALTYAPDEDGWYVISEAPTDAEVAAYAPTLKASATKLETEDDLKAISSAINKKYKSKLATHDIYKITYDMADLGTFINAYDEDYNNSFFGLYNITIGFDAAALPAGYEVAALNYVLPNGATGAAGAGVDAITGILNVVYTADGVSYDKIFPARTNDEGIVVDAGTFKAEYLLAYPKTDEAVTLAYSGTKVVYQKNVTNAATTNVACDDLVLGAAPAPIVVDEKAYELVPSPSNPETKTVGFKATVNKAAQYVQLAFDGADLPVVIDFGVSIAAPKTFGLNIMKVPAGKTITAPTAEIIDAPTGEAGVDYILAR